MRVVKKQSSAYREPRRRKACSLHMNLDGRTHITSTANPLPHLGCTQGNADCNRRAQAICNSHERVDKNSRIILP